MCHLLDSLHSTRAPLSTSDCARDVPVRASGTEMHPRRKENARDTRPFRPLSRGYSQICDPHLRNRFRGRFALSSQNLHQAAIECTKIARSTKEKVSLIRLGFE